MDLPLCVLSLPPAHSLDPGLQSLSQVKNRDVVPQGFQSQGYRCQQECAHQKNVPEAQGSIIHKSSKEQIAVITIKDGKKRSNQLWSLPTMYTPKVTAHDVR